MYVRCEEMPGHRFDGFAEVAHEMGVSVIEADADVDPFELLFDEMHQRIRTRERIRYDLERDSDVLARRLFEQLFDRASREFRLIVIGRDTLGRRRAEMDDEVTIGDLSGERDGWLGLLQRGLSIGLVS